MASRPAFVPAPPEEDEPVPQLNQLVTQPAKRLTILRKVQRCQEINDELSPLVKEKKRLSNELKILLGQHSISRCMVDDISVNYFSSVREGSIKMELLLQNNVPMSVIKASKGPDKTVHTLRIGRVGGDEDEEE